MIVLNSFGQMNEYALYNRVIIGLDNGLSSVRRQTII